MSGVPYPESRDRGVRQDPVDERRDAHRRPVDAGRRLAPEVTGHFLNQRPVDPMGPDGFSKFLQTAKNPRGGKAGPPMPAYMLRAEDADAIAAYLKSLP